MVESAPLFDAHTHGESTDEIEPVTGQMQFAEAQRPHRSPSTATVSNAPTPHTVPHSEVGEASQQTAREVMSGSGIEGMMSPVFLSSPRRHWALAVDVDCEQDTSKRSTHTQYTSMSTAESENVERFFKQEISKNEVGQELVVRRGTATSQATGMCFVL